MALSNLHTHSMKSRASKSPLILAVLVGSVAFATPSFADPVPLWQYGFNNNGDNSGSTGATSSIAVTAPNSTGANAPYTADGLGVSGAAGDYAFANTTTGGAMDDPALGLASVPLANLGWSTFSSFTVTGWYKTPTSLGIGSSRLFDAQQGGGFQIFANGGLNFQIQNASNATIGSWTAPSFTNNGGDWVFFAVTYDSTIASGQNVFFYTGGTSTTLTSVAVTVSTDYRGMTFAPTTAVSIGGDVNTGTRGFNGLLDDFRLYGSTSDGTGALSMSDIEAIRIADATAVPEPQTIALCILGLGMTLTLASRHRRGAPRTA